jgi:aldose 1-epimerase
MNKQLFHRGVLSVVGGVLVAATMVGCGGEPKPTTLSGLVQEDFQSHIGDKATDLYTLRNSAGMEVCITNFGGRVVSIMVPDRNGEMRDVVLGFDNIDDYRNIPSDFGAAIGRYANRIKHGRFVLEGDTIQLPQNNYGHCLHGGPDGWQYRVYDAQQPDGQHLLLNMISPDGDSGFPGEMKVQVTYTLTDDNALAITYDATTNRPTIINMTNHSYFNLSGDATRDILDHELTLNAEEFTPINDTFITLGNINPVEDTPFDFRTPTAIGAHINDDVHQLEYGHGYDHNWVLATRGSMKEVAARLYCPETGIQLEVFTDEPGIQVYTGNFLDGTVVGKKGIAYARRTAVCLETQHYPDTPNKPQWPSVEIRPGRRYFTHCTYRFSVVK